MNCPCECNRGKFCGGCGHAGCGWRKEYAIGQRVRDTLTGVTGTVVMDAGGPNVEVRVGGAPGFTRRVPRGDLSPS